MIKGFYELVKAGHENEVNDILATIGLKDEVSYEYLKKVVDNGRKVSRGNKLANGIVSDIWAFSTAKGDDEDTLVIIYDVKIRVVTTDEDGTYPILVKEHSRELYEVVDGEVEYTEEYEYWND